MNEYLDIKTSVNSAVSDERMLQILREELEAGNVNTISIPTQAEQEFGVFHKHKEKNLNELYADDRTMFGYIATRFFQDSPTKI